MSDHLSKAAIALFRKHIEHYAPPDPLYLHSADPATGRKRKRTKRPPPPGLTKHDARILRTVQSRAHHLDTRFSLFGLSFGYAFLLSLLIPFLGPVLDALLSYLLVIRKARQARIPPWLLARMEANSLLAACISLIPIAGDLFLAIWKPNWRNAALLEEFLRVRGEEAKQKERERETTTTDAAPLPPPPPPQKRKEAGAGIFQRLGRGRLRQGPSSTSTSTSSSNSRCRHQGSSQSGDAPLVAELDPAAPTPIDIDTDTDRSATDPHSLPPTTSTSTSGGGGSSSTTTASSNLRKKTPLIGTLFGSLGRGVFMDEKGKAPPAGEKGRFIEHVPDHELWRSQLPL